MTYEEWQEIVMKYRPVLYKDIIDLKSYFKSEMFKARHFSGMASNIETKQIRHTKVSHCYTWSSISAEDYIALLNYYDKKSEILKIETKKEKIMNICKEDL